MTINKPLGVIFFIAELGGLKGKSVRKQGATVTVRASQHFQLVEGPN
jgi:hypothetical protein